MPQGCAVRGASTVECGHGSPSAPCARGGAGGEACRSAATNVSFRRTSLCADRRVCGGLLHDGVPSLPDDAPSGPRRCELSRLPACAAGVRGPQARTPGATDGSRDRSGGRSSRPGRTARPAPRARGGPLGPSRACADERRPRRGASAPSRGASPACGLRAACERQCRGSPLRSQRHGGVRAGATASRARGAGGAPACAPESAVAPAGERHAVAHA